MIDPPDPSDSPDSPGAPVCRLCGFTIRRGDDAAMVGDEYFHAPCAEPAFKGTPSWSHMKVGDLNMLAQGMGRGAQI